MSASRRFRVGVVGHGVAERLHRPVLETFHNIDVVSIELPRVTDDPPFSYPRSSFPADLDLFIVGAPPYAHFAYTSLAFQAGVATLCEKPAGLTGWSAHELLSNAPEHPPDVWVNYQLRFDPLLLRVRRLLERTGFDAMEWRYSSPGRLAVSNAPAWYRSIDRGGGILYSVVSHLVDASHFLGVTLADLACKPTASGRGGRDGLTLAAVATCGAPVVIEVDGTSPTKEFSMTWLAAGRWTSVDFLAGRLGTLRRPVVGNVLSTDLTSRGRPWRDAFGACVAALLRVDFEGARVENLASLEDAAKVHRVLDTARLSLDEGRARPVANGAQT